MSSMRWIVPGVIALWLATAAFGALEDKKAQSENPPGVAPAPPAATPEEIKAIWPAGLQQLVGRFVFVRVATPGGLWETFIPKGGAEVSRQVSLNEIPAAFRDRLLKAEISISELQLPTMVEASQRPSPSKRGMLRFYTEETLAKVEVKNLPGVAGRDGDKGSFSGRVLLRLDHQSHSNPSVSGVLQQRMQGEPTWGVAALDYADLMASALPPPPKDPALKDEAPKASSKPAAKSAPKAAPKPDAAAEAEDDHEGETILTNARILRGGVEIFAFVEWSEKTAKGDRKIYGCARLLKAEVPQPRAPTTSRLPRSASK